jgi:hypothetical protein
MDDTNGQSAAPDDTRWRDHLDPEGARQVVRETCEDIADVRGEQLAWNAEGFGNRLIHLLVLDGDAVTPAVAGDTARALEVGYYPARFGAQSRAPRWLNTHLVGDVLWHRLVAGASRQAVRHRLESHYHGPPPSGDGLRHDPTRLAAAFLYPGDRHWLFASRFLGVDDATAIDMLTMPEVSAGTAVLVTLCLGLKPRLANIPHDPRAHWAQVRARLQMAISRNLAPVVVVYDDSFWRLESSETTHVDLCREAASELSDHALVFLPHWEIGEIWGGSELHWWARGAQALSAGLGSTRATRKIAHHERSNRGIPIAAFDGVDPAQTMSALQIGFGDHPYDTVIHEGSHTYQGTVAFMQYHVRRMARWDPRHVVGIMEHSIPRVPHYPHASPTDLAAAKRYGRILMDAGGAAFDWNGLQVRA